MIEESTRDWPMGRARLGRSWSYGPFCAVREVKLYNLLNILPLTMFRQQNGLVDPMEVPFNWPVLGDKI